MKIKLSNSQWEIIRLMQNGWSLAVDSTMNSRVWLQEGKIGHGGKRKNVHRNTFYGLYKKGLIKEVKYGFPSSLWTLTELGRVAKEQKPEKE